MTFRWIKVGAGARGRPLVVGVAAVALTACVPAATSVSPSEIPGLRERVARSPGDTDARYRYAAALYADDRCSEAVREIRAAREADPDHPVGALVEGRCLEAEGSYDRAIEIYDWFLEAYPNVRGRNAVLGQRQIAVGERAGERARLAISANGAGPLDPQGVAVLPLEVEGPPEFQPLSRGLAVMIMADLALLERFNLLERLEVAAIVGELDLAGAVNQQTAAEVGRIVRAGQTVQGTADVSSEESIRLSAVVVRDGATSSLVGVDGELAELMAMQKNLVFAVSEAMGYVPSPAERARILENGTGSLVSALAYARGLEAMDLGDYGAAVAHFQDAVAADPGFTGARTELAGAAVIEVVSNSAPEDVTRVGDDADGASDDVAGGTGPDLGGAITASVADVAALDAERVTGSAGDPDAVGRTLAGDPTVDRTTLPNLPALRRLILTLLLPGS